MKIKKRNIELATSVSIIMLLVLAYVHFADEEELFRVGNRIEEILHIYTNISVVKMQSFIEVVTSGVLGSALVALFFYVQDYYCEREKELHNAIEHINEFSKTYSEIPFCRYFENTDYAKLARDYYIEYYDNEFQLEVKKTADDYLKTIPKAARRVLKAEINNKKFGESYEAKSNPQTLPADPDSLDLSFPFLMFHTVPLSLHNFYFVFHIDSLDKCYNTIFPVAFRSFLITISFSLFMIHIIPEMPFFSKIPATANNRQARTPIPIKLPTISLSTNKPSISPVPTFLGTTSKNIFWIPKGIPTKSNNFLQSNISPFMHIG